MREPNTVNSADFIACHHQSYVSKYNLLAGIERGGKFLLNCVWNGEEMEVFADNRNQSIADWNYAKRIGVKELPWKVASTVKGSQFSNHCKNFRVPVRVAEKLPMPG